MIRLRRQAGDEAGSITLMTLGMVMIVMLVGWVTIDLYAGFAARRELAAAADQAAQAGANALDVATFRASGVRQLDPDLAERLARDNLADQTLRPLSGGSVTASTTQVVVVLEADVDLGLLDLLGGGEPLHITVTATGTPRPEGVTP